MTVTVGIDLGTTNSCIAVHARAEIPRRDELIAQGALVEVGNALVVADPPYSGVITPSAVWIAPDGEAVVGYGAKQYATVEGEPPPATLFKRAMGYETTVTAGYARLTPAQASTHVLRHLRETAERVLGVPVERAIVTVPAHFESTAKTATTEAAQAAGLQVVETLFEPVAGALAYADQGVGTDSAGGGTFLVYDLGGGTFDVSVVAWDDDGSFDLRGTDGDRHLGGIEFDKALLRLVVDDAAGVDLAFDENDPGQAAARARLLALVERAKIDLTISPQTWLVDQNVRQRDGRLGSLRVPVTRDRFEEVIAPEVDLTLEITDRVVNALTLGTAAIGEVVLVGGSSRVPLVRRRLAERFGRPPHELDQDLCVGVGAALRTAAADDTTEHLVVAQPLVTDTSLDVTGQVVAGGVLDSPARRLLSLTAEDGSLTRRAHSGEDGGFAFLDLPLPADGTELVLTLLHGDVPLDTHRFTVSTGRPAVPDVDPLIARTFWLLTRNGRVEVVAGGQTKLPHRVQVTALATTGRGNTLLIPVFEGDVRVQDLTISGLPADLPEDTPVEVELTFAADWTIDAVVSVPSAGARGEATWTVTQRTVEPWDAIEVRFHELSGAWEERRPLLTAAERVQYGPGIERLVAEVRELVARQDDLVKTNARVEALATRLPALPQPVLLDPPASEFEIALDQLAAACDALERSDPERASAFRADIPVLRSTGYAAWRRESQRDWSAAIGAVRDRCLALDRRMASSSGPAAPPDPGVMQSGMLADLDQGVRHLRRRDAETGEVHHAEADRLLAVGDRLRQDVTGVSLNATDAVQRLRRLDGGELQPWLAEANTFPPVGLEVKYTGTRGRT